MTTITFKYKLLQEIIDKRLICNDIDNLIQSFLIINTSQYKKDYNQIVKELNIKNTLIEKQTPQIVKNRTLLLKDIKKRIV